ncbi:TIGR01777 family protein [Pseudoclavibacter chungangensis]|uniref:TIGR01777 family protein n=1 Tax=Pseudoclavibacter chungangensis TaxID=587635 RepID=A0A7J5BSI4_9MICO|nr:TIGR01777 family oxidoreductase [Pseudoclavibacter chungangensis]KAB1657274.1 TIGR01777 family protein [Pseudoclavibacter chungangensis]NYJ66279.1 hypothetical protein [Pseudoclavibacter chungangensis]
MTPQSGRPLHVVVSGASGLVGRSLVPELESAGHLVTKLVRREPTHERERQWNPGARQLDPALIDGADAIVNLSGARLSRLPWTYNVKKEILRSRVNSTLTLTTAMQQARVAPPVLLNASASGAYGDRPGERLTEDAPRADDGFLPRVVERWEAAAARAPEGTRVVNLRTGLVVGPGGFLAVLRSLASLGLLTRLGTGEQHWPWVSLIDEVRAIQHLLTSGLHGPVNLAGPTPATANEVLDDLGSELNRPVVLKTPSQVIDFTLREAGRELFLSDQLVVPQALLEDGFVFRDTTVEQAIGRALRSPQRVEEDDEGGPL